MSPPYEAGRPGGISTKTASQPMPQSRCQYTPTGYMTKCGSDPVGVASSDHDENSTAERDVTPDRALPTWAIDLLMDGAPTYTPATKIWGRAVSIAMCTQARGWTRMEFINEFTSRTMRKNKAGQKRYANHKLWEQIQAYSKHGNSGVKELDKAWEQAMFNLIQGEGLTTPEELINDAIERAWAWETRLDEGDDGLSVAEASVVSYVITEIERRQMARVTCPCRVVGEFAKLSPATAARTLKNLAERGFLVQFARGICAKGLSNRKAAIYSLSDPLTLRVGGRGGPSVTAVQFKASTTESPRET